MPSRFTTGALQSCALARLKDQFGTELYRIGLLELYVKRAGGAQLRFTIQMDDGRCFGLTINGGLIHWTTSIENSGPGGAIIPTEHDYAELRLVL